jgi:hypothetical protein
MYQKCFLKNQTLIPDKSIFEDSFNFPCSLQTSEDSKGEKNQDNFPTKDKVQWANESSF